MPEAGPIRTVMSRREWIVVALLVFSVVINYIDRSNLSLAMPILVKQFSISPYRAGELLGAFSWTYALVQVFGLAGWLADRFPAGWVLFLGYLLWSLSTAATGLTASFAALFALRLLLGLGESVAYPCYSRIFAAMPQEHRGRANALIDAGTKLGPAAGAFLGGLVLVHFGWKMLFGVFGIGALAWLLPWYFAMPRGERIAKERQAERDAEKRSGSSAPTIAKLLRMRCAWGAFIGHFCGNYFYFFLLSWLPTYLVQEEHLSIRAMTQLTAAVFGLIACSTIATGWTTDRLIARGASPTIVRRAATAGGSFVASIFIALWFIHGHPFVALAVLAIGCVGYGAYASNHWAITQTLAGPAMAGRWSSLQNGVANFSGIIAPWLAGFIVQARGSARLAFVIAGGVALVGAAAWLFLVRRVEPVNWDTSAREARPA